MTSNIKELELALSEVALSVDKLSESSINLAQCDFILSNLIEKLTAQKSTISNILKNCLIKRINQRRTDWSDLCLYFNFSPAFRKKSLFYVQPNANRIVEAIQYIEGANEINKNTEQSTGNSIEINQLDYDNLIRQAANPNIDNQSNSISTDLENWLNHGIKSQKIERFSKVLMTIKPTSIDSERCFSVCTRIITPMRNRLSAEKLCIIVFLYENRNN